MSDPLTLPGMPRKFGIRDPLERCYTPDALAQACVDLLPEFDEWRASGAWTVGEDGSIVSKYDRPHGWSRRRPLNVLEPSVGGGAFVRALHRRWPELRPSVRGVDQDRGAAGLRDCFSPVVGDFLALDFDVKWKTDLVIGNPPFSSAEKHVERALMYSPIVAFVLPLAILGVKKWQPYLDDLYEVHPIVGRPWPKRVRETAFFIWRGKWEPIGPCSRRLTGEPARLCAPISTW